MMYTPSKDLDKTLLASIPTKVFKWLNLIGVDTTKMGEFENLEWDFNNDKNNFLRLSSKAIEFEWDGNILENPPVFCNDEKALDISTNLEWFVDIEFSIYQRIEKLESLKDSGG